MFPRPGLILPRGYQKPAHPVINPTHPLSRGLIGCWLLGSKSIGSAPDISGRGADGVFNTDTPLIGSHHGGLANNFSYLNSNYVSIPNSQFNFSNQTKGSVSWWTYPNSAYNAGDDNRFQWGQTDSSDEFNCRIFSDNNWYCGWNGSGGDTRAIFAASAANYPQSQWNHYILDWDGTGTRMRLNGAQIGSTATAPNVRPGLTSSFILGRQGNDFAGGSNGRFEGFRVYNRVLSSAEGYLLYSEPYAGINEKSWMNYLVGVAAAAGARVYNLSALGAG